MQMTVVACEGEPPFQTQFPHSTLPSFYNYNLQPAGFNLYAIYFTIILVLNLDFCNFQHVFLDN